MIARDKYLNELIKAKGNGFSKVITGIRRCGKSYLLDVIYRDYLLGNGVSQATYSLWISPSPRPHNANAPDKGQKANRQTTDKRQDPLRQLVD